jgi:hypothetical protein
LLLDPATRCIPEPFSIDQWQTFNVCSLV